MASIRSKYSQKRHFSRHRYYQVVRLLHGSVSCTASWESLRQGKHVSSVAATTASPNNAILCLILSETSFFCVHYWVVVCVILSSVCAVLWEFSAAFLPSDRLKNIVCISILSTERSRGSTVAIIMNNTSTINQSPLVTSFAVHYCTPTIRIQYYRTSRYAVVTNKSFVASCISLFPFSALWGSTVS